VARPADVIVATVVFDEDHVTLLVISRALASEYVPVAVKRSVSPLASEGLLGVTAMDCRAMTFKVKF